MDGEEKKFFFKNLLGINGQFPGRTQDVVTIDFCEKILAWVKIFFNFRYKVSKMQIKSVEPNSDAPTQPAGDEENESDCMKSVMRLRNL